MAASPVESSAPLAVSMVRTVRSPLLSVVSWCASAAAGPVSQQIQLQTHPATSVMFVAEKLFQYIMTSNAVWTDCL
jgi:hypothetical protein